MNVLENEMYREDVRHASRLDIPWEKLENKALLVTGQQA